MGYWMLTATAIVGDQLLYANHLIHPNVADRAGWRVVLPPTVHQVQHEMVAAGAPVEGLRWEGCWVPL